MPDPIAPTARRSAARNLAGATGLLVAIALGLPGCASDPTTEPDNPGVVAPGPDRPRPSTTIEQLAASAQAEAERTAGKADLKLPLPELLTREGVSVSPLADDARATAAADLDAVLTQIKTPDYLTVPDAADQPVRLNDETPLAAVKAYVRGLAAFRANKRFEAINYLEAARRLDPKSPHILRLLGRVYFTYRNEVKGAQRLEQAVRLAPDDAESLFLLGRVAFARQRWDEAIATLARSSRIEDATLDPGVPYQLSYYLSQALFQRGFDAAAIDQAQAYAALPDRLGRTTRFARTLDTLERQRGRVYQQIGDALCRLGRFAEAADHYNAAADLGATDAVAATDGLAARQVYTLLAIDRPRSAEYVLVKRLADGESTPDLLSLAPYVADHSGRPKKLAALLRSVYEQSERPGPLAMAIAGMLDADDGIGLLADHLQAKPDDLSVFRFTADNYGADHPKRVLPIALSLIEAKPDAAREYAGQLTRLSVEPDQWLGWLDELAAAQRDSAAAWYLRGAIHEAADRIELAADAYDEALAADGDFLSPHTATIQLQIRLGRYDRALALLDRIKPPVDDALRYARVRAYLGLDRLADAQETLDQLIAAQPRNPDYRLTKARLQIAREDLTGAQATLWSILNFAPTNEDAYTALFILYESDQWDDDDQWVRLLKEVRQQIPSSRIARLKFAEYLIRQKRYDQAIVALREFMTFEPGDADGLRQMVIAYYRSGRIEDAERVLIEQLEREPDDLSPLASLRELALVTGKLEAYYPRAEKHLLATEPSYMRSVLLARTYMDWDKKDKVAEALEQAGEHEGDATVDLRVDRARLYNYIDQSDRALAVLDDALTRHPGSAADILYEKSSVLHGIDRKQEAEATLLKALEANPNHVSANNDLGYFWADAGKNLDRALEMTRKAVAKNKNTNRAGGYLDSYAWVLYKLGRYAEAAKQFELARTKPDGNDPVILDHYGDTLWRLNERPRAGQIWQDALRAAAGIDEKMRPSIIDLRDALTAKIRAAIANEDPPIAPVSPDAPQSAPPKPEPEPVELEK